jgi:hypothetical protein
MIEALERDLPSATLLIGPDLEKMVLDACLAARWHHVAPVDGTVFRHLSAADARNVVRFAQTAPFGPFKLVIAALDGSTSQAQNILLKVLEEPPLLENGEPAIRFILVATARPLPTIVSRCEVITVSAPGLVQDADGKVTTAVNVALRAALTGDLAGLDGALHGWGDAHHSVLCALLCEAAAGRDPDPELTPARARRLLGVLGRFSSAHPRLATHAALTSLVLSDREQHD